MGHICFHYTCNRLWREEDRKQPWHPNGFIPVFPWAFIRTKSAQQPWAGAALYRVNIMISPTFFWGRDWPPDWHILCKAVLGHTGHLLQYSASSDISECCLCTSSFQAQGAQGLPRGCWHTQTSWSQQWRPAALLSSWKEKDNKEQVGNHRNT